MDLHVCKKSLRGAQMAETYLIEARGWADFLVRQEFRGPGDTVDAAMARCERKHKIDHSLLWGLRYRVPKDLFVSAYMRLRHAYEIEKQRMDARLLAELVRAENEGLNAANSAAYRMALVARNKTVARP